MGGQGASSPPPSLLHVLFLQCLLEGVRGRAPPGNFENYTSNGAVWRHLVMKSPCNSSFKLAVVMLMQTDF